jgi:hypothetical protein
VIAQTALVIRDSEGNCLSQAPPLTYVSQRSLSPESLFILFYQIYLTWCLNAVHARTKYIVQVREKRDKERESCTWPQSHVRVRPAT